MIKSTGECAVLPILDFNGLFSEIGYQLKAGQFEVKSFVVSLSDHERPTVAPP